VTDDRQTPETDAPHGTRRGFFGLAAASIAGLVAGRYAVGADDASAGAVDGEALNLGQKNTATGKTELSTSGVINGAGALVVDAPNASYGVQGSAASIGVYGRGPIGVLGEGAVGGVFAGTDTAISLTPTGVSGAPTTASLKGDISVDADGVMWFCVADGTPGTWIRLSHGGTRFLDSPYRVFSSTNPGAGGVFTKGEGRSVQITGVVPGVPANALGVVGNVTIHHTVSAGFVTVFPAGTPLPPTSSLNWFTTNMQAANAVSVRLGGGAISIYADGAIAPGAAACDVIFDVSGYVL